MMPGMQHPGMKPVRPMPGANAQYPPMGGMSPGMGAGPGQGAPQGLSPLLMLLIQQMRQRGGGQMGGGRPRGPGPMLPGGGALGGQGMPGGIPYR